MLQPYTFVRYFLYSTVTRLDTVEALRTANNDIFNGVISSAMEQVVSKYLEGKSCFLPTATQAQANLLLRKLRGGFESCSLPLTDVVDLNDAHCNTVFTSPCIIVGRIDCEAVKSMFVDWTFYFPVVSDIYSDYVISASEEICIPVALNRLSWNDIQLDKLLVKLNGSELDGTVSKNKQDKRVGTVFCPPSSGHESCGDCAWPED